MDIIVIHSQKKWNISKKELSIFGKKEIESTLKQFNQSCSGAYHMMDYYNQQIITDNPSSSILCGHPKEIADKEGFGFLGRILTPEEQIWASQVNEAAFNLFFNHDEKKRMDLRLSYDLKVRTINGTEFTLHHKLTPFRLCKNGNLWLALCHVIEVASKDTRNVNLVDVVDGKKYNFTNGNFILSKDEVLTYKEKQILTMLAKDMTAEQISKNLSISLPVFNRHKRKVFNKLGVDKSTSAIHKAHTEGLI